MKFLATDQHGLTRISPIGLRPFGLEECLEPCDCLWAIYGQLASGSGTKRFVLGKRDIDFAQRACAWDEIAGQLFAACSARGSSGVGRLTGRV